MGLHLKQLWAVILVAVLLVNMALAADIEIRNITVTDWDEKDASRPILNNRIRATTLGERLWKHIEIQYRCLRENASNVRTDVWVLVDTETRGQLVLHGASTRPGLHARAALYSRHLFVSPDTTSNLGRFRFRAVLAEVSRGTNSVATASWPEGTAVRWPEEPPVVQNSLVSLLSTPWAHLKVDRTGLIHSEVTEGYRPDPDNADPEGKQAFLEMLDRQTEEEGGK